MERHRWVSLGSLVVGVSFALTSTAAEPAPECAPDEWICERAPSAAPPDAPEEAPPGEGDAAPAPPESMPAPDLAPYEGEPGSDGRPHMILRTPPDQGREESERLLPWLEATSQWSANFRLQGVFLNSRRDVHDAGLAGLGGSLRYRVNPVFSVDVGFDVFGGKDYNGYDRGEATFSFGTILYFDSDASVRPYVLLGVNATAARVDVDGDEQSWGYLGGHAGLGLEIPLHRRLALDLALLGFIRGRTDGRAAREPEFHDSSGRVTNSSGGALFRAGLSVFW